MPEEPLVTPVDPKTLESEPVMPAHPVSKPNRQLFFLVVILAGIGFGYLMSARFAPPTGSNVVSGSDIVQSEKEVGSTDTATFRDSATGTLEVGGSNGEGTHKLIRDGGPSQTVYLISSIVDLNQFVGKKVEVWGETIKAQKVGWLMDVGRVKIVE